MASSSAQQARGTKAAKKEEISAEQQYVHDMIVASPGDHGFQPGWWTPKPAATAWRPTLRPSRADVAKLKATAKGHMTGKPEPAEYIEEGGSSSTGTATAAAVPKGTGGGSTGTATGTPKLQPPSGDH